MLFHKIQGAGGVGNVSNIEYISSSVLNNVSANGSTGRTVTAPTNIQDGDMLIACYRITAGVVTNFPSGFTQLGSSGSSFHTMQIAYKIASSESGDYAFTFSANNSALLAIGIGVWRGASNATLGTIQREDSDSLLATAPSMTASAGLLLGWFGFTSIRVPPSTIDGVSTNSMTQRFATNGVNASSLVCFEEPISSGSTGTRECLWVNNTANTNDWRESVLLNLY
jgi:hypothetical protein